MLLKAYTLLGCDFSDFRWTAPYWPASWLDGAARAGREHQRRLLTDVGLPVFDLLDLAGWTPGDLTLQSRRLVSLPILLQRNRRPDLGPSPYGTLAIAWLGSGTTHVEINLGYEPKPIAVKHAALAHRIAESVLARVVNEIADRLLASSAMK